ncbi:beta subunit of N-acylethanolamine-hydrolyzing acid amidase-domain-containing protein [Phialemonium atrogriseum]|uniref:ceramidase n=1 Tax=Phialemonium atrogriseum TaxID=1093897 RepID=A0AAJ0CB28_9PEZI|nr:beta subunit of N-acylethanolamine-hydrolyzing acid amidase-domain-containing protein [Phialemonium atrogriseum]KAK1771949.1 beta subunit of N-acylethanolamine-hydrolyzing acid amidase-domain-containing protein [Phialemonium atrogriseum]
MESIGLRERPVRKCRLQNSKVNTSREELIPDALSNPSGPGHQPPKFTIDLSLPPEQRYSHVVPEMLPEINNSQLESLFTTLVSDIAPRPIAKLINLLAPRILRRVYSDEENAELRGIAQATRLPMHLLVAFNVLLDLLMGCTSGGVRVEERVPGASWESRVLHFRTLDWAMDPLRHIVVELDFVRRPGGPVVATSLTYLGYVGVLTGVREGLSLSLNFRPYHDSTTWRKRLAFKRHQLLVVLGRRPSISSVLRSYIIPRVGSEAAGGPGGGDKSQFGGWGKKGGKAKRSEPDDSSDFPSIERTLAELSSAPSTSAYLVLCTPQAAHLVEQDHRTASVRASGSLLVGCNHDCTDEDNAAALEAAARDLAEHETATGMDVIIQSSIDRKCRVDEIVREALARRRRELRRQEWAVAVEDVLAVLQDPEVSNSDTHYAAIMDPQNGKILWRRVYMPGELGELEEPEEPEDWSMVL